MKKITTTIALLLILSFVVTFSEIGIVKAESTIYIRADGTVEGTDKIQRDGDVYPFISDISGSIVVEKNDIVIDGAGFIFQGNGGGIGIDLSDRNNITVKNMELRDFNNGIWLEGGSNNTVIGNTITSSNEWGIRLMGSLNNTLSDNSITANSFGGVVVMANANNNTISENTITNNLRGLDLTSSENNTVSGNYIANNIGGIALENMYNSIFGNIIANNSNFGIHLYGAGYNNIIGNNITNNGRGILVSICYNNVIYHNNFVNNTNHVETDDSNGIWDNGEEGNYWDNYTGNDNNDDGIGDTAYVIAENNQDNYPLMKIIPEFPSWIILPPFIVATLIMALIYFKKRKH